MLTRLSAMLPINVRGMWIGTFHGLCNRFLRAHWKLAALPQGFQILDIAGPAVGRQARHQGDEPRRRALRAEAGELVHRRQQGRGPAPARRRGARRADAQAGRDLPGLRGAVPARRRGRLRRADAAHATSCCATTIRCASTTSGASATCWSTSSRTPTACSTRWLKMFAPPHGRPQRSRRACSRSATTTRASTPSAARKVGNMADFEREYRVQQGHQAGAELPLASATSSMRPTR